MSDTLTLSLPVLMNNITDVSTIKELLKTYNAQLKSDGQYELPVIFPILVSKSKDVNRQYKRALSSQERYNTLFNKFVGQISKAQNIAAAISEMIIAADFGTEIYTQSKDLNDRYVQLFASAQYLRDLSGKELIDSTVNVSIPEITSMHPQINATIENGTQSKDWVVSQIADFSNTLHTDVRNLSTKTLRQKMAKFYTELTDIVEKTATFYDLILKKKAVNPLISEELVALISSLDRLSQKLHVKYTALLNLVYIHSDQLLAVNNAVLVYQSFAGILENEKK